MFSIEIDGHSVTVRQSGQQITVLDGDGNVIFRDRIQVAAGSVQGLFVALDDLQQGKTA